MQEEPPVYSRLAAAYVRGKLRLAGKLELPDLTEAHRVDYVTADLTPDPQREITAFPSPLSPSPPRPPRPPAGSARRAWGRPPRSRGRRGTPRGLPRPAGGSCRCSPSHPRHKCTAPFPP